MFDICVFAGRFRPFHKGHLHVITEALNSAQYLFILVGSVGSPINPRNPFTFAEVREMIRGSLHPRDADRVFIFGVEDQDNDIKWVQRVQQIVSENAARLSFPAEPKIALIGCGKDSSSYYLKLFPQWESVSVPAYSFDGPELSSTAVRDALFNSNDPAFMVEGLKDKELPHGTYLLLREWIRTPEFYRISGEHRFMADYLAQFDNTPYPRNFNTADAVVIQSGFVLLVRRGEMPGEGLWALPGGHIRQDETFLDAAIRELIEETQINKLDPTRDAGVLRQFVRGEKLLDNPNRSTRKRTVSVAYLFDLTGDTQLPFVEGSDDAREARWWPLNDVIRDMMFEDHFMVIEHFKNQIDA